MNKIAYKLLLGATFMLSACIIPHSDENSSDSIVSLSKSKNDFSEQSKSNKTEIINIDSSEFEVRMISDRLEFIMERNSTLEEQLAKIENSISLIAKESRLKSLNLVILRRLNEELLMDISIVPEIQSHLERCVKTNKVVNSMEVISTHAYKSDSMHRITSLFLSHELEPYDYYIDKCLATNDNNQVKNAYIHHCASISFRLKESSHE